MNATAGIPPETVCQWLEDMKAAGRIRFDRQAADMLGIGLQALSDAKRKGFGGQTSARTALAMAAILQDVKPYGERETP